MKKKTIFLFGCAVMVIAALFTLGGCPSPTSPAPQTTKFQGTWNGDGTNYQFIFADTDVVFKQSGANNKKGTFTFTATDIILNYTHTWSGGAWTEAITSSTYSYTLSGNTLSLGGGWGDFTKQ